jgi:hypothetical protein
VVKKAAQLVALANELRMDGIGDGDDFPHPIFWPALSAEEAREEWDELRAWVNLLRARFPNLTRIPECWWRHNDLVELLVALRDYERACFSPTAPATAGIEWHRALRDMEIRMELWVKKLACGVAGRGHGEPMNLEEGAPNGWHEFVDRDVERRSIERDPDGEDVAESQSPTPSPSSESTT